MKKKQKGKLVLGLFMGCCLLYCNVWIFHKIRTGSSISPKRGRAVSRRESSGHLTGGKIQTKRERRCKKYRSKESGYKEYRSREHRSKGSGRTKKYRTNDLTQNATGASAQSGTYGNVKWKLSGTTLTITGSGAMPDASLSEPAPWSELNVKSVVISEGITVIGQQNFCRMSSITSVSFSQSLQTIKEAAFYECSSLTGVKLAK